MYGGAGFLGFIESHITGGSVSDNVAGLAALPVVAVLVVVGDRLPRPLLAALGPIGVALIGYTLARVDGPGDGAVLYMWPTIWAAHFFGRRFTAFTIAWIGAVHAWVLVDLGSTAAYADRWLDVVVTVAVTAVATRALTERHDRMVAKSRAEARIDALTGLTNRRGFEERLELELARADRTGSGLAVAAFDLDHFKAINDRYGHGVGDQVLAHVGEALRHATRTVDLAARTGGEEFTVLLTESTEQGAFEAAERIRAAVAVAIPGLPPVTVSAGVAAASADSSHDGLLAAADSALYEAKRRGRDRTVTSTDTAAIAPRDARHDDPQSAHIRAARHKRGGARVI